MIPTALVLVMLSLGDDPLPNGANARLGTTRFRSERPLVSVVFAPDDKTVLTASDFSDNGMIWDVATGEAVQRLRFLSAHDRPVFRTDGKFVASNGIWDVQTGKHLENQPGGFRAFVGENILFTSHDERELTVLFDPNANKIIREFPGRFLGYSHDAKTVTTNAVRRGETQIVVRELATGKELHRTDVPPVWCQYRGQLLLCQSDANAKIYDTRTRRSRELVESRVNWFAKERSPFSPDGTLVAAADLHFLRLWDTATGELRSKNPIDGASLKDIRFSPDGKYLATAFDGEHPINLWDVKTGKLVHQKAFGQALDFSSDGATMATCDGQSVRLWETVSGTEIRPRDGARSSIEEIVYSPDGRLMAVAGNFGPVGLWDVATSKELHRFPHTAKRSSASLSLSKDGKKLAYCDGNVLVVASTDTGKQLHRFDGFKVPVKFVAFSADGTSVAGTGSAGMEGRGYGLTPRELPEVRLWDLTTGKELPGATGEDGEHTIVALDVRSPQKAVALAIDRDRLYDLFTKKTIVRLPPEQQGTLEVAISPDGTLLAWGCIETVQVIELATGKTKYQLPKRSIIELRFSPDSRSLVGVAWNTWQKNRTHEWDMADGKEVSRLPAIPKFQTFAFAPDGRTFATGGANTTVTLWAIKKNEP